MARTYEETLRAKREGIVPIARGGSHDIGNLRWLCHEANLAKRALFDEQFFALCLDVAQGLPVMAWIGRRIQTVSDL